MAGQPQNSFLWFNVKDLRVSEPASETPPPNVVDYGNPFNLSVTLEGKGMGWKNMCNQGAKYKVTFYAERFGGNGALEIDFTPVIGNLTAADYNTPLDVMSQPLLINGDGVYRLTCMVEFPEHFGVLGFPTEELLIQVSAMAEMT